MAKIKGAIDISTERCKGCSVCVEACPFDLIELSGGVNSKGYQFARSARPDDCTGCTNCAVVCPDGCIVVYRQKNEAQS